MKRQGLLHAELSALIARLGHTDLVVIADRGLPVPPDVPLVDLALVPGQLPFLVALEAVLGEIVVQRHTVATEALGGVPDHWFTRCADALGERVAVPHEEFKTLLPHAAFVVRTGEETAYANIILECGVPF